MDDETIKLTAGALSFSVAALVLLASLLSAVELPAVTYILIAIGLFAGVFLIGLSHPEQPV